MWDNRGDRQLNVLLHAGYIIGLVIFLILLNVDIVPKFREGMRLMEGINKHHKLKSRFSDSERKNKEETWERKASQAKTDLSMLKDAVAQVNTKAVVVKNVSLLTLEVEDIAQKAKVLLDSVQPTKIEEMPNGEILLLKLRFKSRYDRLVAFMAGLENAQWAVGFGPFHIDKKNPDQSDLDVDIGVYLLLQAEAKTLDESHNE